MYIPGATVNTTADTLAVNGLGSTRFNPKYAGMRPDNFWNNFLFAEGFGETGNRTLNANYKNYILSELDNRLKGTSWDTLSDTEKSSIIGDPYTSEWFYDVKSGRHDWGGMRKATRAFDFDAFVDDVMSADEMYNKIMGDLEAPNYADYYKEASDELNKAYADTYSSIDEDLASLSQQASDYETRYNGDLRAMQADYEQLRSNTLSSGYMQNAALMDTMRSDMARSRRNALEAGASAGIRIAGNINTMLSVQNKQSQQSLETSNQLAQMLLNQRNAERGLRGEYDTYMQNNFNNRTALRDRKLSAQQSQRSETNSLATERYNAAKEDYNYKENKYLNTANQSSYAPYAKTAYLRGAYNNPTK